MIQQLLLIAQFLIVALIYLFVWRVMRTATRDITRPAPQAAGVPQDSTIIPAAQAASARRAAGLADPRIVVLSSSSLREGVPFTIDRPLTLGRAADNDIVLDDSFVSSHHARVVPPATLVDLDSTNGTRVNGTPLRGRANLRSGDTFQIGETNFRFEVPR